MGKIWRPFTQHQTADEPIAIKNAKGAVLTSQDGSEYLDLTSSWWVTIHSHCEPSIAKAISQQAKTLEHNIAADTVNAPAKRLAQRLGKALASDYIFFSDNGSTAVEVALKLAWQAVNHGSSHSSSTSSSSPSQNGRFIAFEGGYHGDTLGAMSAGFSSGFYNKFEKFKLNNFAFAPFPATWQGDNQRSQKEKMALEALEQSLNAQRPIAVIFEPLVQGAAGMKFCSVEFTNKAVALAKQSGALVIFDEVMTAFGRLGKMFAQDLLTQKPHMTCMAKGLTGGFLPMGATAVNKELFNKFLGDDFANAFAHGHSYTANPISAAAANASLDIFAAGKVWHKIATIGEIHRQNLTKAKSLGASKPRQLGAIAAFEWGNHNGNDNKAYGSTQSTKLKQAFLKKGLLLRPIGNTIYLLPPYDIEPAQLEQGWHTLLKTLSEL